MNLGYDVGVDEPRKGETRDESHDDMSVRRRASWSLSWKQDGRAAMIRVKSIRDARVGRRS